MLGSTGLLAINELGFPPLDADGARLVFQVFADDQMAAALIGRVVHHGHLIQFREKSYRVSHTLIQKG